MMKPLMATLLSLGLLTPLLAGCANQSSRDAENAKIAAEDDENCRELGFEPGTEAYGNCRLKLKEIRAQERANGAYNNSNVGFGIGVGISKGF